jgi:cephalosporin-C deacetylase
MPLCDLSSDELRSYAPELRAPADLEEFWATTLTASRSLAEPAAFAEIASGLTLVDTFDASFSGFGGQRVKAWLHLLARTDHPVPVVVNYAGYGGGRGLPHEVAIWALAGYASFSIDLRGQGAAGLHGTTGDAAGGGASYPGFMTRGVQDPRE